MAGPLYLDSSAVLRAILEAGTTPEIEQRIAAAPALITSRLTLVESARAFHRVRKMGEVGETRLADAERQLAELWHRCEIWELEEEVCSLAERIAPTEPLRTLDALHLATFILARRRSGDLDLLTADDRLREAAARV